MRKVKRILAIVLISTAVLLIVIFSTIGYRDIPKEVLKEKYGQAPSQFMLLNDLEVHFKDGGANNSQAPILLLHGTGSSLHTFNGWIPFLEDSRRVIRLDLPGYGLTDSFEDGDYSIARYVEFLHSFTSELDLDRIVIAGNSLGGKIAWNYALEYPQEVDGLILINSAGVSTESKSKPVAFTLAQTPLLKHFLRFITPKSIARRSLENVYYDKSLVNDELVDRYFELTLCEGNRDAFIARFNSIKRERPWKDLSLIQVPTLILWGEHDMLIPVEAAHLFSQELPNDSLVILPGMGHVPMEENPERSVQPLLEFLSSKLP
jgi:pimeloyl-ACP methyl ester carboxylesterase